MSISYKSTRGGISPVSFSEAVMMGLADDGGLLVPSQIPEVSGKLSDWRTLPYTELAYQVMKPYVEGSIPDEDFHRLVEKSYATFAAKEIVPVKQVGEIFIAELFHGPTLAFKDVALQLLGNLFEYLLAKDGGKLNIIGATSGDTGSAAIHGVRGKQGIDIFIMFPEGRVSPLQERQMTTLPDANVHPIAIRGTFDDGQRVLKQLFNDMTFKWEYHLGAVNSVNWARVLAQVVYYFWGAFRAMDATGASSVQVSVPTGNFGDIFAGYIARRMGAPISRLILATNENDILSRFFNTGTYSRGDVHPTLSPSMDIQVASNFERYLFYRLNENPDAVRSLMEDFARTGSITVPGKDDTFAAGRGDTEATLAAIRKYHSAYGYILDPHTAVGVHVAEQFIQPGIPMVCLATASPAKFSEAIIRALGSDLARHPTLEALKSLPIHKALLDPTKEAVKQYVIDTLG